MQGGRGVQAHLKRKQAEQQLSPEELQDFREQQNKELKEFIGQQRAAAQERAETATLAPKKQRSS